MPQLSIIVPAYNIAPWVERCLQSLMSLALPGGDYEVVVVDDGATDATPILVEDFARKYPQIRVVRQVNAGLAAARNAGIDAAKGTYLWFVDGDDWIHSEAVPELLAVALRENLDILCFGMEAVFADGRVQPITGASPCDGHVMGGLELVQAIEPIPSACTQFYRRDFLLAEQLRFYVGIVHEDQEFTPRAYCLARRVMRVPDVVYVYFQRANSIQRSVNPRKAGDLLTACASLKRFGETRLPISSPVQAYLDGQIAFCFSQALANYVPGSPGHAISMFTGHGCYPLRLHANWPRRLRLKYRLINASVRLYLLVYGWHKK